MKRTSVMLVTIIFLLAFSGCSKLEINGLENYRKETCSVSLTEYLFPSDGFLDSFEYFSGEYRYCDTGDIAWGYVKAFAHLSYEPEIYVEAKKYCMDNWGFCENHEYESNGYQFHEHLCHKTRDENGELNVGCDFPKHFNMFGYCDESCTLFFLGYYNGNPKATEKELAQDNWGEFLQEVYGESYDFTN